MKARVSELGSLSEVVMGCERGASFRYYPAGTDTDKPMTFVLRAITHDGGNLRFDSDGDVRAAHVWYLETLEPCLKRRLRARAGVAFPAP
jgi:hypothetical protein